MQTVEKSDVNADEPPKASPLVNGQHLSSPSSSDPPLDNGDSTEPDSKNDSEVPPDPTAGILRSFSLSEERLSHIQISKVKSLNLFNYPDI